MEFELNLVGGIYINSEKLIQALLKEMSNLTYYHFGNESGKNIHVCESIVAAIFENATTEEKKKLTRYIKLYLLIE
jgi:hypothetical protein